MRLLIITPEFSETGGGIATFYRLLAPWLIEQGMQIRVIEGSAFRAAEGSNTRTEGGMRVETLQMDRFKSYWRRFSAFEAMPLLRRHLAAAWALWEQALCGESVDIVEACDWGLLSVPPIIDGGTPVIVQCHGSVGQISVHDPFEGQQVESAFVRLLERSLLSMSNMQTYSRANAAFWERETGRAVQVLRPAFRADVHSTGPLEECGLVVGRVQRWKGPATLCDALQALGASAPNLDWIGRDAKWGSISKSSSSHLRSAYPDIWGPRVNHIGVQSVEEVRRRQSVALFNLAPSTWDVFNFTAIEAMSSGRPTIVSDGAGASELIQDGVNGFLFEANNATALASAIERTLSEPRSRSVEIGRAAQETIRAVCDPRMIALKRVAAYNSSIIDFRSSHRGSPSLWLNDICSPREPSNDRQLAFLENQPLSAIIAFALRRLRSKMLSWTPRD
jgi:glycosyltransferase involved in cell wall biosynthesis